MRQLILFGLIGLTLCASSLVTRAAGAAELTDEQMQSCWDDLLKSDPEASRALLSLSASPQQAVTFFKAHLLPLKVEADQVNRWIKDLESDDEEVWKPAFEKLSYFDPRLAIELGTLMSDVINPPARPRLVEVLSDRPQGSLAGKDVQSRTFAGGQNFVEGNGSFWAEKDISRLSGGGHPK